MSLVKEVCDRTGEIKCRCYEGVGASGALPVISLHATFRKLFSDHKFYLASFSKSCIFHLPDEPFLRQRLLENAADIGLNLGRLSTVGAQNGQVITALFTQHVQLGEVIINASKIYHASRTPESKSTLDTAIMTALKQGDDIAFAFSTLKPDCLPIESMIHDFRMHNNQEVALTDILLEGRFAEEVPAFDEAYNHILGIADNLYFALRPAGM